MSFEKVSVRRHVRKRTGRTAEIAASLGFPTTVKVGDFSRRRPERKEPPWVGGKWEQKAPGLWQREYATGVYGNVLRDASPPAKDKAFQAIVYSNKPQHQGSDLIGRTWENSLFKAQRAADEIYQDWFIKEELRARAEFGLLFPREPLGGPFGRSEMDTDDLLLVDLNVPPEKRPALKRYMADLKRTNPPRVNEHLAGMEGEGIGEFEF